MQRSVFSNLLRQGAASGTNLFLFVLAAVAGRYLGPEDFGVFSFALAFVFFFDFLTDPGLYHLLIREISRSRDQAGRFVRHAMLWKLIASPVAFGLIALGIALLEDSPRVRSAVYIMAIASFLKSANDVYRSALIAHERFDLEMLIAFLERGSLLIVGALLLFEGFGLMGLCWTFVGVRCVVLLIARQLSARASGTSAGPLEWTFLKSLIRIGAPIGAFYVTLNVYNYVDTVMISVLRNPTETGWYGASFRVYEGLRLLPNIVGTVLLPRMSRTFGDADPAFGHMVSKAYKYIFFLALVVSGVGVLLAEDVILVVFGSDYEAAIAAFVILLVGVPFVFVVHLLQSVLIAANAQGLLLKAAVAGLVANVGLNAFAIPAFGYLGAAAVTVGVEGLVCLGLSLAVHRQGSLPGLVWKIAAGFVCFLVSGGIVVSLVGALPQLVQAILFATGFLVMLWVTGLVDLAELRAARASRQ